MVPAIILDCDIRAQEGVIQPLGRHGIPIIAVSSKHDCPAFHSKYTVQSFISPRLDLDEELYVRFLMSLPQKGVLFYSNDLSAVVISKHQQKLKEGGFLLNIVGNLQLEEAFDKWRCYLLAQKLGIPMAKSKLITCIDDVYENWDFFQKPLILKGTRLAGGKYYKIKEKNQIQDAWQKIVATAGLEFFKARKSGIIMQEWHDYDMTDNWSCETVYDNECGPVGFFTVKRIRCSCNFDGTFSSRLYAGYYEYNQQLVDYTKIILNSLCWRGFAHVEYFYVPSKKQFFLTEINPRLPGYSYYPGSAGFNMAFYYYADLVSIKFSVAPPPPSIYFQSFRYPGDIIDDCMPLFKGYVGFIPFVMSYLQLLMPGRVKIVDPIRLDDLAFTVNSLWYDMKKFFLRCFLYIKKQIGMG